MSEGLKSLRVNRRYFSSTSIIADTKIVLSERDRKFIKNYYKKRVIRKYIVIGLFIMIVLISLFAVIFYSIHSFFLLSVIILLLPLPSFVINNAVLSHYYTDLRDNTKMKSKGTLTHVLQANGHIYLSFRKEGQPFCEEFIASSLNEEPMLQIDKGADVEIEFTSQCRLLLIVRSKEIIN